VICHANCSLFPLAGRCVRELFAMSRGFTRATAQTPESIRRALRPSPGTPSFMAARDSRRNQRSPGRLGSASSSSSGSSRASSSGRRLRVMRYGLGSSYVPDGGWDGPFRL
jgi:hypothetical protein